MPQIKTVGIIGLGFVGGAALKSFTLKGATACGYDKYKNGGIGSFDALLGCDAVFLCLPTLYEEAQKCYNKSAICEVCQRLALEGYSGLVVLKSTVEPETTTGLSARFPGLRLCHNPEFLTARTAFEDFHNQDHIVLGQGPATTEADMAALRDFYAELYPAADITLCSATESESMKIMCNSFYASKVMLFNEYYLLCQKNGADFQKITALMLKNGWINPMHTTVPGPDGQLAYGGACFPKDTNALCQYMVRKQSEHGVLAAVIDECAALRESTGCALSDSQSG